jgi:hypothetical protein
MQNELEAKLCEICNELHMLENAPYDDRVRTLESMKKWLEGLIANYCE